MISSESFNKRLTLSDCVSVTTMQESEKLEINFLKLVDF